MTRRPRSIEPAPPDAHALGYAFETSLEPGRRREFGSYYTPLPVIRWIIERTLGPIVRGEIRAGKGHAVPLSPEEILGLRILDPAMGAGHFLVEAVEYLARAHARAGGKPKGAKSMIAERCLYGVDIEPSAVETAKRTLRLCTQDDSLPLPNLRGGDALIAERFDGLPAAHPVFNWPAEFPLALSSPNSQKPKPNSLSAGFHAILGNPPYLSFGLRGARRIDPQMRAHYLRSYPGAAQYKISVYALFVERAMELLSPGGFLGFVLPDSFLLGKYFEGLRKNVLGSGKRVHTLLTFRDSFWKHGEVGRPVVLIARKSVMDSIELQCARDIDALDSADGGQPPPAVLPLCTHRVSSRVYSETPLSRFYFFLGKADHEIYRRVTDSGVAMRRIVKFYSGLIGKKGKSSIVFANSANHREKMEDAEEMKGPTRAAEGLKVKDKGKLKTDRSESDSSNSFPPFPPFPFSHNAAKATASPPHSLTASPLLATGRALRPFRVDHADHFMLHDPALYKSGYKPVYYENPKLFLNQTGDRPKACVDESGLYCLNNMHVGIPHGPVDALYLAAGVLNSRFGQAFYAFISMESGRAMAQIDIDVLDGFPMPADSGECARAPVLQKIVGLSRRLHALAREEMTGEFRRVHTELDAAVLEAYGLDPAEFETFAKRVHAPFG